MEIGVVVGRELGLPEEERTRVVQEAADLGYVSAWTNAGAGVGSILTCQGWFEACGIPTGIASVVSMKIPPAEMS